MESGRKSSWRHFGKSDEESVQSADAYTTEAFIASSA